MNINDRSGRLIRWSLPLSEHDFEVRYKKVKANTQADAFSRLETSGGTVVEIEEDIPCFLCEESRTCVLCKEETRHESSMDLEEHDNVVDSLLALQSEEDEQELDEFVAITQE